MLKKNMGYPSRLRDLISWAVEAYELAAYPPAQDYTRKIDPNTAPSRPSMLHIGIDVKYIVHHQLSALPPTQSENIIEYLTDPTHCFIHTLNDYQKYILKDNIRQLKQSLINNGYK